MSKTIKVKIAVSVDANGHWSACGWGCPTNPYAEYAHDHTVDTLDSGEARYWIVAELSIPYHEEIKGEVTDANG